MKKTIFIMLIGLCLCASRVSADKIHLKTGEFWMENLKRIKILCRGMIGVLARMILSFGIKAAANAF
ncbi:MAG: hypothetical protein KAR32_05035 [Candidatus Omnitrophica bacterium]|nr:hypothetical protein [Candidatus Omnitrophota bacterium]